MSYFAFVTSVLLGIGSLSYAYAREGVDMAWRGLLILGALWLFAGKQRWVWFSTIALVISVSLAAYGLWVEYSPGWMITGALGALLAWDLTDFMRRLRYAPLMDDLRALERRHLTRLMIVTLVGVALASIAMFVRVEFTFEWTMLLAFIAVLAVTQLVSWLRHR